MSSPIHDLPPNKTSGSRTALKVILSVLIAYHLAAVCLLPNSSSMLGRKLGWLFLPYANPTLFNRTWQFFSPGPMPVFYLEYELETETNSNDMLRTTYVYPEHRKSIQIDDFYMRTLAGMRFLALQDVPFEKYFVEYLCRQHPEALALDIRSVVERLPDVEDAGRFIDFKDMADRTDLPRRTYACPGRTRSEPVDEKDFELDPEPDSETEEDAQ